MDKKLSECLNRSVINHSINNLKTAMTINEIGLLLEAVDYIMDKNLPKTKGGDMVSPIGRPDGIVGKINNEDCCLCGMVEDCSLTFKDMDELIEHAEVKSSHGIDNVIVCKHYKDKGGEINECDN